MEMLAVKPAFWLMVWVFAVEHPNGAVTDRMWNFKNHMGFIECDAKAKAMTKFTDEQKQLTEDGGKALYSRFVCVPVSS